MVTAMNRATFSLEVFGEQISNRIYGLRGDNSEYISRLKTLLHSAIESELTECQRAAVTGFYFEGKSVTALAEEQGVNKSTVSRNLKRARIKLAASMRYALSPIYLDRD
jgi:RNA polymerase sigma factor (sigma-70 family)